MRRFLPLAGALLLASFLSPVVYGQGAMAPRPPAAIATIREADITRDMWAMAGDEMRGREAGTLDEMRASIWVADAMERAGVKPFGESGSWFQWWNIRRTRIATGFSAVRVGGQALTLWKDITPTSNAAVDLSAPTVFVNNVSDTTVDVRGRVAVVTMIAPPAASIRTTTNTPDYNYARAAITALSLPLTRRGATGVIIVADSIGELVFDAVAIVQKRGAYDVVGGVPRFVRNTGAGAAGAGGAPRPAPVPVLLARRSLVPLLRGGAQFAEIQLREESFEYPSVNVIGMVRGTDPKLRDDYVLFSSHQDHDGVRYTVDGDSIWNGADDNATTSVALLAIARAWVKQPSKRSALFIFHGAEEKGLLGSRYYVAHPVVPLERIAAVLNGDMLGRNHPDTAALMGSQPPHRNSMELVEMAIQANRATSKFVIDSLWDRPSHPEGWYFRSDHVPYAERNVPSLFFSSNLHNDYHTPRDEPKTIDYPKLTRMTQWMYMTGWLAANSQKRPAIDAGFVLK